MILTKFDLELLIKNMCNSVGARGKHENSIRPETLKTDCERILELLVEYNKFPPYKDSDNE